VVVVDPSAAVAIDDVAAAVAQGKCILFLGAGAHSPPPQGSAYAYPEAERPPLGSTLSRQLAEKCNVATRFPNESLDNLQRMSLFFETEKGRKKLVEEIRDAVQTDKRPSPLLRALAELDFPLIITTNFDRLFERALVDAGKDPQVSVYSPDSNDPTEDYEEPKSSAPFLFKIHGDVNDAESLVVTDEDYIQFVLRMSDKAPYDPVPLTLRFYLMKWTTLFVGYSLVDYNLRLLFKTLRWHIDKAKIPDTYSVDLHPDPLIFDVWHQQRRYVTFIAQDVWTFVPALYDAVLGKEMPDYRH
jgi:SIR2-like domain